MKTLQQLEHDWALDNVRHCTFMLNSWQRSVDFWERSNNAAQAAASKRNVKSYRMKLLWANQRAAMYSVTK